MIRRAYPATLSFLVACAGSSGSSPSATDDESPPPFPRAEKPVIGTRPAWVDKGVFIVKSDRGSFVYGVGVIEISLRGSSCGQGDLMITAAENRARAEILKAYSFKAYSFRTSKPDRRTLITDRVKGDTADARPVDAWFDGAQMFYVLAKQKLRADSTVKADAAPADTVHGGISLTEAGTIIRAASRHDADQAGLCAKAETRAANCCGSADLYCDDPSTYSRIIMGRCRCGYDEPCTGEERCLGEGVDAECSMPPVETLPVDSPWKVELELHVRLNAIGSGPHNELWVVGDRGFAMRHESDAWMVKKTGTTKDLNGIWIAAKKDAWAVGEDGTVLHWNGSKWKSVSSRTTEDLRSVWGSAANDVWFVGDVGTVLRWNGKRIKAVKSGTNRPLAAVWGADVKHVWAAGFGGMLFWNGKKWTETLGEKFAGARCLWGTGGDNVLVGGNKGLVQWNGSAWNETPGPKSVEQLWGSAPDDLWAASRDGMMHYDGSGWTRTDAGEWQSLRGIAGNTDGALWAVGARGVYRFEGQAPAGGS